jgi:hypothetical protein
VPVEPIEPSSEFEVEAWLANFLAAVPEVVAQLGGRVFPICVPTAEDLPALTYRRKSTSRAATTTKATGSATAVFDLTIEAQSNAQGYLVNCKVARGIRLRVDGLQAADAGQALRRVSLDDEVDQDEGPAFADEAEIFQRKLTLTLAYKEQTRTLIGGA